MDLCSEVVFGFLNFFDLLAVVVVSVAIVRAVRHWSCGRKQS